MKQKTLFRLILAVSLLTGPYILGAQTLSTGDFLAKVGFQMQNGVWTKGDSVKVVMNADYVAKFIAKQTHDWQLIFGDGKKMGMTLNIRAGQLIQYQDGVLDLGNGQQFRFEFSEVEGKVLKRGILKSPIFNSSRISMNITDIKPFSESTDKLGIYTNANSYKREAVDLYGNFCEKVDANEAAENAKNEANKSDMENAQNAQENKNYNRLCAKYGKDVIDQTLNGYFVVGAPIELLKKVQVANATVWETTRATSTYCDVEFRPGMYPPHEWHTHQHARYNIKTGKVTYIWTSQHFY